MLAMLKHLANLQEAEGKTISLEYSTQLQQMIDDLAADEGQTAEEYLTALVAEFQNADADEDGEAEADDAADDVGTDAVAEEAAGDDDSTADADAGDAATDDADGENAGKKPKTSKKA
jgi:ATPase subunit of ABC transporter with duplicated ATPase domains